MTNTTLQDKAERYLAQLHDDQAAAAPPDVDESSVAWADAFLAAVRQYRDGHSDREARRSAQRLGRGSTKDRFRFFWELWQNADDAEASSLRFTIEPKRIVIENDGKPFTTRDAYSACFVASSQKTGDIAKKGQYGIGFLSLMRIASSAVIRSGPFSFRLERDFTYPSAVARAPMTPGTKVEADLRDGMDREELIEALIGRLDRETLLYMAHLRTVEVVDAEVGRRQTIECSTERDSTGANSVRLGGNLWRVYRRTVQAAEGLEREDGEPIAAELPIVLARTEGEVQHRVAAYFPIAQHHRLPWSFSAPFEVTNNRESLAESDYNHWLLGRVGEVMVDAALDAAFVDRAAPWLLMPGATPEEGLEPLYESAHERMRNTAWLPTAKGRKRPSEVAIPASAEVRKLLRLADLESEDLRNRAWIGGDPPQEHKELLEKLGAFPICCHELSECLAGGPRRDAPWYLRSASEVIRLVGSSPGHEAAERLLTGNCFKDRRDGAFSLRQVKESDKVVCNARSQPIADDISAIATPQLIILHSVYRAADRQGDPLRKPREVVQSWLQDMSERGEFAFERRLEAPQFIRHFLASAKSEDVDALSDKTHDSLLVFVRKHLTAYIRAYPNAKPEEIGARLRVAAFSHDAKSAKVTARQPLSGVYLSRTFAESAWASASREVPGLWWISAKYKTLLAGEGGRGQQEDDRLGVPGFLRTLGALDGPRLLPVQNNRTHGYHHFQFVTRGDKVTFPNFPHDEVSQGYYSEYGLKDDHVSPDLDAVVAHIGGCSGSVRNRRAQDLLRALERHWERLGDSAWVDAYGYYANGEKHLGRVPARWLFTLRTTPWVRFADGRFLPPVGGYANTRAVVAVLGARDPEVCAWNCGKDEVAGALGLDTSVSAKRLLARLDSAKASGAAFTRERAVALYKALAEEVEESRPLLRRIETHSLVYLPTREGGQWWPPSLCFTSDQRHIFGDRRAYLTPYKEAQQLWSELGVEHRPTLLNLAAFWEELSALTPDDDLLIRLTRSYESADGLCSSEQPKVVRVPLWTNHGWRQSDEVGTTEDDDLGHALEELDINLWTQPRASAYRRFASWCGVALLDDGAAFGEPAGGLADEPELTRRLHVAAGLFGSELAEVDTAIWRAVASRCQEWREIRVVRSECLDVPAALKLQGGETLNVHVRKHALVRDGCLYLSPLADLEDGQTVAELIRNVELTHSQSWSLANALRLKLMEARDFRGSEHDVSITALVAEDEDQEDEFGLFSEDEEHVSGAAANQTPDPGGVEEEKQDLLPHPAITAPAVDAYEVASDKMAGTELPAGGEIVRGNPVTRPPGRSTSAASNRRPGRSSVSTKEVERRGLELIKRYVLVPAGILIADQTIRPGVGADLYCSDRVFRELKVFSNSATSRIHLTRYEQARAESAPDRYELIVIEHVWSEPRITIVPNPLEGLNWQATGGIDILNWQGRANSFRQITLQPGD